ncbi:MAG: hypothetical protein PHQ98_04910 [Candidatus ainarchaeum sp.]|nr:hypothetical protein [Candidatus ainarchaeum sp.]
MPRVRMPTPKSKRPSKTEREICNNINKLLNARLERSQKQGNEITKTLPTLITSQSLHLTMMYLDRRLADKIACLTAGIAIDGIVRFSRTYAQESKKVKEITHQIGKLLAIESEKNEKFKQQISSKKYLFINNSGEIVLTNQPRILGIGRLRLETKKILNRAY